MKGFVATLAALAAFLLLFVGRVAPATAADNEFRVSHGFTVSHPATTHRHAGGKETYAEARARAITENKPLLVWVGEAICPACIRENKDEFVHYVSATWPDAKDAVVVADVKDGELYRVGSVTQWVTGDATFGHIPSSRRVLARWRSAGAVSEGAGWPSAAPASPWYGAAPPSVGMSSYGVTYATRAAPVYARTRSGRMVCTNCQ